VDRENFTFAFFFSASSLVACINLKGPYSAPRSIGLKRVSTVIGHSIRSSCSSYSDALYLTYKAERITSGVLWQKGSGLNNVVIDTLKIISTGCYFKRESACRASDFAACRF